MRPPYRRLGVAYGNVPGSHPFPTAYAVGYMSNARFAGCDAAAHKDRNGYGGAAKQSYYG